MRRNEILYIVLTVTVATVGIHVDSSPIESISSSTLRLVHILYRHGDRSPVRNFPLDPISEKDWPQGFGQLTQRGMNQEYQLGKYLREKYVDSGFMSAMYNRSKLYVRSTDYDRTLMSAYCVLAGLYPTIPTPTWNNTWQPIPVHTETQTEDYLLHTDTPCPARDRIVNKDAEQELKTIEEKNKDFIKYVSKHSGYPPTLQNVFAILDPLFCENEHKKIDTSKGWLSVNKTFTRLMKMKELSAKFSFTTKKQAKLTSGLLVGKIISNMNGKINGSLTEDMVMFSAHDSNVMGLLSALGIYSYPDRPVQWPQYTSSVAIELHEHKSLEYIIRIYFRNVTKSSNIYLHRLAIPGCTLDCPLSKFTELLSDVIVTDIKKECHIQTPASNTRPIDSFIGVTVLGGITGLVILLLIGTCVVYCKNKKPQPYRPIPNDDNDL